MKVKVSEASGVVLDWMVAECEELNTKLSSTGFLIYSDKTIPTGPQGWAYQPSSVWAQGGPIIDTERISIEEASTHGGWIARNSVGIYALPNRIRYADGPTALIAAMRCYVASKLGDYADVPEELAHA